MVPNLDPSPKSGSGFATCMDGTTTGMHASIPDVEPGLEIFSGIALELLESDLEGLAARVVRGNQVDLPEQLLLSHLRLLGDEN